MKYFKKYEPRHSKILLGSGTYVQWVETETEWGVYSTDDAYVIQELGRVIARGIGGVVEITEGEYRELKKKEKNMKWSGNWRETISLNRLRRMYAQSKNGLAAAVKHNNPLFRNFKDPARVAPPTGVSDYRPKALDRGEFEKAFAR